MADTRRTRDYQPDAPLDLQYLNDPSYTPLDRIGGQGMGGAGNDSSAIPAGGMDFGLENAQSLGDQRTAQENQLFDMLKNSRSSYRMMTPGEAWQGLKDAGSSGMDLLGRGLNAITPSQDTVNNIAMRLQNAHAIGTGQTPLYMLQQQHALNMAQADELMSMKRQQLAQQLQSTVMQKRQQDMGLLERAINHPRASMVLDQLSQDPQFTFAKQAGMLSSSMKDADIGSMQAYQEFIPQEVQQRFMAGNLPQHELTAWLDMARENAKTNAKAGAKQLLLKQAMGTATDQRTPFQQSLVDEHQAEIEAKQLKNENTKADTAYKLAHAQQAQALANGSAKPDRTTMNRVAVALTGQDFEDLPRGGPAQQMVLDYHSKLYPQARNEIQQNTPVPVNQRSDVIKRDDFLKSGALNRPPPGVTQGQMAKGDYIQMSDSQQKQAADIDKAGGNLRQLFGLVMPQIKAKTPMEAGAQYFRLHGSAALGQNADAATYKAGSSAFSSQLARVFGGEVGTMTDQDIARWKETLPTFGDTQPVAQRKQKLFFDIYDTAVQAFRNQVAGQDNTSTQNKLESLLKEADKFKAGNTPPSQGPSQQQSVGEIKEGKGGKKYRFKGGDRTDKNNWELVQ